MARPPFGDIETDEVASALSSNAVRNAEELLNAAPSASPNASPRAPAPRPADVRARPHSNLARHGLVPLFANGEEAMFEGAPTRGVGPSIDIDRTSWAERYVAAPFGRGVDRFQALASLGFNDTEEFAEQQRQMLQSVQLTAQDQRIMERIHTTDSAWEAVQLYANNPRLITAITAESLGLFLPVLGASGAAAVATAATGGAAAAAMAASAAAMGAGSFGTEYLATIEGELAGQGINLQDADQVNQLLADDRFMAAAREKGVERGIPIAIFDALSMGLAGKLVGSVGKGVLRKAGGYAGELGLQMGAGAGGEAAAQLVSEGQITSKGDIVSEAAGEILGGGVETAIGVVANRNKADAPNPAADPAADLAENPPATPGTPPVDESVSPDEARTVVEELDQLEAQQREEAEEANRDAAIKAAEKAKKEREAAEKTTVSEKLKTKQKAKKEAKKPAEIAPTPIDPDTVPVVEQEAEPVVEAELVEPVEPAEPAKQPKVTTKKKKPVVVPAVPVDATPPTEEVVEAAAAPKPKLKLKKPTAADITTTDENTAAEIDEALAQMEAAEKAEALTPEQAADNAAIVDETFEREAEPVSDEQRLTGWMRQQSDSKADGVENDASKQRQRVRELFRTNTGTKKTPSAFLKDRLVSIAEAALANKFLSENEVPTITTTKKRDGVERGTAKPYTVGMGAEATATFYAGVVKALDKRHPKMAQAMRNALDTDDPSHMANVLEGVLAIMRGASDVHPDLLGTGFEPVISKYERARNEADNLYAGPLSATKKPKLAKTTGEAAAAVFNMIRGTEARLLQLVKDNLQVKPKEWSAITNGLKDFKPLSPRLAAKIESLAPGLAAGFTTLTDAKRIYSLGNDVTATKAYRTYNELVALGEVLRGISKDRTDSDQRLMEKGLGSNTLKKAPTRAAQLKSKQTENQLRTKLASLINRYAEATTKAQQDGWTRQIGELLAKSGRNRKQALAFLNEVTTSRKEWRDTRAALSRSISKELDETRAIEELAGMETVVTDEFGRGRTEEDMEESGANQEDLPDETRERVAMDRVGEEAQRDAVDTGRLSKWDNPDKTNTSNNARIRNEQNAASALAAGSSVNPEDLKPGAPEAQGEKWLAKVRAEEAAVEAEVKKRAQAQADALKAREAARPPKQTEPLGPPDRRGATPVKQRIAKSTAGVLKSLRLMNVPVQKLLENTSTPEPVRRFFATLNKPESDSVIVAGFRAGLKAADRRTFDELVDAYAAAEASGAYFPIRDLSNFVQSQNVARPGQPRVVVMNLDTKENTWFEGPNAKKEAEAFARAATGLTRVSPQTVEDSVNNYAAAMRYAAQKGLESGAVALRSMPMMSSYFRVLERQAPKLAELLTENQSGNYEMNARQYVAAWRNSLGRRSWLRPILTRILDTGVDMPIYFLDKVATPDGEQVAGLFTFERDSGVGLHIQIDSTKSAGHQMFTLLHELVHAATMQAYKTNPQLRQEINALFERTKARAGLNSDQYGFTDPLEFIAEAFSNVQFQEVLKSISSDSLWRRFVNTVRRALNLSVARNDALSTIMEMTPELFQTPETAVQTGAPAATAASIDRTDFAPDKIRAALKETMVSVDAKRRMLDLWSKAYLGFMNLDVMERKYREMFKRLGSTAMTKMRNAITRVTRMSQELSAEMMRLSDLTQNLEESVRTRMYELMISATMSGVHVDQPLTAPDNAHLWSKSGALYNKTGVTEALVKYRALKAESPAAAELYAEWRDLLAKAYRGRRTALIKHALQTSTAGALAPDQVEVISHANTVEDFETFLRLEDPDMSDSTKDLVRSIFATATVTGPYFPLRRTGKYVVSVYSDDGKLEFLSMHATRGAAEQESATIPNSEVTPYTKAKDMPGMNDAMRAIIDKIPELTQDGDKNAVKQQANHAMSMVLADNILYSAQLKRKGIAGVKASEIPTSLQDYIRSSVSAISTLDSAYEIDRSLAEMETIAKDARNPAADIDQVSRIRDELLRRASEIAADRDVTQVDHILGTIGFYTYLGAPSYWILNATQTAVVGVPVLAGKAKDAKGNPISYVAASRAMSKAYGTLKRVTKGKGWKALDNLDDVMKELSPEQAKIVQQLVNDNIVQATLAHELGMLTRNKNGVYNRVTSVLQKVPEMLERWNRLAMALAAMDSGVTNYKDVRDIVEASQFNYDPANRARLLKTAPAWLGGGARRFISPMMMFKVFGVNMAELLYGNLIDGFFNSAKTAQERAEARKILYGILGTHTAFGGLTGGLSLGLGQVILAAVNTLWDDEDKIEPSLWLDSFLSEHTNDYIARIVTRGLPAAVGVDMSGSINLGNLLLMSRNTDWSEYGGFEQSVFGLLGPVAQYISGGTREFARLVEGEASVGDFAEKAVPLKLIRSLFQTWDLATDGLETRQGQTFMDANELNVGSLIISGLGLRPAAVAQRQNRFYADRTYNRVLEGRKSELMGAYLTAEGRQARRAVKDEIDEWNAKMRERRNPQLIISSPSLKNSESARKHVTDQYDRREFTLYNR